MSKEVEWLDHLLQEYRKGSLKRDKLEEKLYLLIRKHPRRFSLDKLQSDSLDDFMSWIYPRLSRAIDRYEDKGSSFDAFIISMVSLSIKEYRTRLNEHGIIEKTWWNIKANEMAICDTPEPEYLECGIDEKKTPKITNRRQVLMLLLKSYYLIRDEQLAQYAPALGLSPETLYLMVDELRKLRIEHELAVEKIKKCVYSQFYRCIAFEERLKAAPPFSCHWYKMKKSLELGRKRLSSLRQRLKAMRIEASNDDIAKVMNLAKGTVDSNLFTVKKNNEALLLKEPAH